MPRPGEDRSDVGGVAQFNNIGPGPLFAFNIGPGPLFAFTVEKLKKVLLIPLVAYILVFLNQIKALIGCQNAYELRTEMLGEPPRIFRAALFVVEAILPRQQRRSHTNPKRERGSDEIK